MFLHKIFTRVVYVNGKYPSFHMHASLPSQNEIGLNDAPEEGTKYNSSCKVSCKKLN